MMATAFMGYVLPWGQMSFWGATVITNLFSAIPLIGESITNWLWGGYSVANPTLTRFFSLHYLFPFLIVGLVVFHIWALLEFFFYYCSLQIYFIKNITQFFLIQNC